MPTLNLNFSISWYALKAKLHQIGVTVTIWSVGRRPHHVIAKSEALKQFRQEGKIIQILWVSIYIDPFYRDAETSPTCKRELLLDVVKLIMNFNRKA